MRRLQVFLTLFITLIFIPLTVVYAVEIPVERVTLNYGNLVLVRGETIILKATISPSDASNKNIRWYSSNAKIVQVVSLGDIAGYENSAEIKALSPGSATVTVVTENGEKRAACNINVIVLVNDLSVSPAEISLVPSERMQLTAVIFPPEATEQGVTWESTDPAVVVVDQNGMITAVKPGEARVVARSVEDQLFNDYCKVFVLATSGPSEPPEIVEPEELVNEPEQAEHAVNKNIDSNILIIGALSLVIVIALIVIIRSRKG